MKQRETVTLSEDATARARVAVAAGEAVSIEAYVDRLIADDAAFSGELTPEQNAFLNQAIDESIASGPAQPFDFEEFLARMRAKHGL